MITLHVVQTFVVVAFLLLSSTPTNAKVHLLKRHNTTQQRHTPKIINGYEPTQRYPWIASLFDTAYAPGINQHYCGGALIAPDIVLTAAHCIGSNNNPDTSTKRVQLGSSLLPGVEDSANEEKRHILEIESTLKHPEFHVNGLIYFDYGLVQLKSDATVEPVRFYKDAQSTSLISNVSVLKHMGWGQTENSSQSRSERLMEVELTYLNSMDCDLTTGYAITEQILCGSSSGQNKGVCYGDSGGPIVTTDGSEILLGVASFIIGGCGNSKYPDGFASVEAEYDWIVTEACNLSLHSSELSFCGQSTSEAPSVSPSTPFPSNNPNGSPIEVPSIPPSITPSVAPTIAPYSTWKPSVIPSLDPSITQSNFPSNIPSDTFSDFPTYSPSQPPSTGLSELPSIIQTRIPSLTPSLLSFQPTDAASALPSSKPSISPSNSPNQMPSRFPSLGPSDVEMSSPSNSPLIIPSNPPSLEPSDVASAFPTYNPSNTPSTATIPPNNYYPSRQPHTQSKTLLPSNNIPSQAPNNNPSDAPSYHSATSNIPSHLPTMYTATSSPSLEPTSSSLSPTDYPSIGTPSIFDSTASTHPTIESPSSTTTVKPSRIVSHNPLSSIPFSSAAPSNFFKLSNVPTIQASDEMPSIYPTAAAVEGTTISPSNMNINDDDDEDAISSSLHLALMVQGVACQHDISPDDVILLEECILMVLSQNDVQVSGLEMVYASSTAYNCSMNLVVLGSMFASWHLDYAMGVVDASISARINATSHGDDSTVIQILVAHNDLITAVLRESGRLLYVDTTGVEVIRVDASNVEQPEVVNGNVTSSISSAASAGNGLAHVCVGLWFMSVMSAALLVIGG